VKKIIRNMITVALVAVMFAGLLPFAVSANFDPNGLLTREQAATMLSRLANALNTPFAGSNPTFNDNSAISSWAYEAVGQMQASGVMGGTGSNNFSPKGRYTREQSVVTMLRMFDLFASDELKNPPPPP
jgi:hypothetical protein